MHSTKIDNNKGTDKGDNTNQLNLPNNLEDSLPLHVVDRSDNNIKEDKLYTRFSWGADFL